VIGIMAYGPADATDASSSRSFVLCRQESSLLWTQRVGRHQAQCAWPRDRGGELVGVCSVCATCRKGRLSRREQLCRVLANVPH